MSEEGVIWLRAIFSCVMPLWGRYFFVNDRRDGVAYPYGRFCDVVCTADNHGTGREAGPDDS